jgi:soluble lytic murein transglycosylase-like protein
MVKHAKQYCAVALLLLVLSPGAQAYCFTQAAQRYQVDAQLLMAIAKVESGYNARAFNANTNGSKDIGLMQINSSWLPVLRKHGIDESRLWDACVNVHVGAWVLANNIAQHGATWRAVGAYNARSSHKQSGYVQKVWAAMSGNSKTKKPQRGTS